ncbi:YndM family protein [Fredinandcohnia humi]
MKHLKALGIKFIVVSIVILSLLGIFGDTSVGELLLISLLVTAVAYILGDLFILPRMGNLIATVADIGLAFFTIWALSYMFLERTPSLVTAALVSSLAIGASEAIFHAYMQNKVLNNKDYKQNRQQQFRPSYQTEFAEENELPSRKKRD